MPSGGSGFRLRPPGEQHGPCDPVCDHLHCRGVKILASRLCGICNQPLGYNTRFYFGSNNDSERLHLYTVTIQHKACADHLFIYGEEPMTKKKDTEETEETPEAEYPPLTKEEDAGFLVVNGASFDFFDNRDDADEHARSLAQGRRTTSFVIACSAVVHTVKQNA